ncbi:MAG: heavy metal translocating P-type ATPase [Bryobacteraceae bacterium]
MANTRSEYRIRGMDCAEEVSLLRRALSGKAGVFELSFDVVRAKMIVEHDAGRIDGAAIAKAVDATGMRAEPWTEQATAPAPWRSSIRVWLTLLSGVLAATGSLIAANGDISAIFASHPNASPWALVCYLGAILAGMAYSAPKAWAAVKSARPEMNVLVCVSILGAGYLSEWSEGASLAFLFSLAALLEVWSLERARNAVSALVQVAPVEATVIHDHGEHRMQVDRVAVGERVRIRPGERVPCDGDVLSGGSSVDQALITGESVPIWKETGDSVFAGTMNTEGTLDVRVTKAATDTTLARIVRMVSDSGARRSPSEHFIERFSRIYTPVVMVFAMLVAAIPPIFFHGEWSYWFYQGMVILLISCPCALVISTPVTVVAALAAAARNGILVKGGVFLEQLAGLQAIAFDKTGVLTQGEPAVARCVALGGRTEESVLSHLAALEGNSEHPLARAIVRYAAGRGIRPEAVGEFYVLRGRGAEAEIGGETFWAGSHRMLLEKGLEGESIQQLVTELDGAGHTAVFCGTDEQVWGVISLADPLRPEARASLKALRGLGARRLVMLTGDNRRAASTAASAAGLDEAKGELLPEDKAAEIETLQAEFGAVAMVGDGVNDAQALAVSDVGIALGRRATDVALETADVVLMADDLGKIPLLWKHARRTAAVIRQNVIFALAIKAVFLVVALFGLATLWMAVAADMGATLLVTLNGLRLMRFRAE